MTGSKVSALLEPITIGSSILLRNRVCMGSMTRNRCINDNKPTKATVTHYEARARDGAGLIVAEGTFIYLSGSDWLHTPVMFKDEHAAAWKKVTDAVHKEGGLIFFQPWHAGRCQNENMPMLRDNGYPVLAPSNIPCSGGKYRTLEGEPGYTQNLTEITNPSEIIQQYRDSVALAKKAGFDGIELLAQGDYLLQNFLLSRSNQRTDKYGGTTENRCRFILEVLDAVIELWGENAVGVKICPTDDIGDTVSPYNEISETFTFLVRKLIARNISFINLSRRGCHLKHHQDDYFATYTSSRPAGSELPPGYDSLDEFGPMIKFPGSKTSLMVNHEYTVSEADRLIDEDKIDLVAFGRPFIHNPDLITRVRNGVQLAENDRGVHIYYGPYNDPNEGYNDWPCAI